MRDVWTTFVHSNVVENPVLPKKALQQCLVGPCTELLPSNWVFYERNDASAIPLKLSASTSTPLTPSVTISGTPPTLVHTNAFR